MKISITIDTEPDYKTGDFKKTFEGIIAAEKLFDKYDIKPTLFLTCDCIENFPSLFMRLKKKGWEMSSHGYRHFRFDEMSKKRKLEEINKAENCFKKYLKTNPPGFRAPQFSSDFELLEILEKKKFLYDSSVVQFPLSQIIFFRKKFKLYFNQIFFRKKLIKNKMKLKEIPVSSFIFPISLFTLRKMPFPIFKLLTNLSLTFRKDYLIIFLAHSYEFTPETLLKLENFIIHYRAAKFIKMEDLH